MKRIPYGISDYKALIEKEYVFVDKTKYIEKLENYHSPYIFFLRPRRFGKSLFTSMLTYYYDSSKQSEFENLFKDSYIGINRTKECGQYCVLNFTFSGLDSKNKEILKESFMKRINLGFLEFTKKYNINIDINKEEKDPAMALDYFFAHIKREINYPIYVIIDEYDHFANELLSFKPELFKDLVSKTGFVRKFYEILKDWTKEEAIAQINKYKTSEELANICNLKKWVLVFVKDQCVVNIEIEG